MSSRARIWLTRPREDSEALAATLTHHGIDSIIAPIMRIEYRDLPSLPEAPDALLITSRHATPMLAQLPESWRAIPVFCVGAATGSAAHDAGFVNISHGDADVLDLLPRLVETLPAQARVLYLSGFEVKVDVKTLLGAKQLVVETLIAYDAVTETALPSELIEALDAGTITGVTFFSPRTATLTNALLTRHSVDRIDAFCLSLAVAEAAGSLGWKHILACHTPTLDAMVNLIVSRSTPTMV